MKNPLIWQIDGKYYKMGFPEYQTMQDILKKVKATELWSDAKKGKAKRAAALKAMNDNEAMANFGLADWVSQPFPVMTWTQYTIHSLILSSAISSASRRSVFKAGDELLRYDQQQDEVEVFPHSGSPIGVRPVLKDYSMEHGTTAIYSIDITEKNNLKTVVMGTLYVDGEPVNPLSIGSITLNDRSDYCIDDTYDNDHALEWIWWHGYLIPKQNLFRIYPRDIIGTLGVP